MASCNAPPSPSRSSSSVAAVGWTGAATATSGSTRFGSDTLLKSGVTVDETDGLVTSSLVVRGFCHATRGRVDEVRAIVADLDRRTTHDREHRSYLWAYVRLVLALSRDDLDAAFQAAEQARLLLIDTTSHALGMRFSLIILMTVQGFTP